MTTCMNGVTRSPLSPDEDYRTHHYGAKAVDFQWEVKTPWNFTVACCCDVSFVVQSKWESLKLGRQFECRHQCNTTLRNLRCSLALAKTPICGQFGWGGTLLKVYQQGPKVNSTRSEIGCGVQEQKLAWLKFYQMKFQTRKCGLANLYVLIDGG